MTFAQKRSPSEQLELAGRARAGDRDAFADLVLSQSGLVRRLALSFAKEAAHLELDDLIQEGYLAVIDAARCFDQARGFLFSTYAGDCVRRRLSRFTKSRWIRPISHQEPTQYLGHETPLEGAPDEEPLNVAELLAELLQLLPPLHRYIVRKRHGLDGDERPIKQIVQSLGINLSREREIYQKARDGLMEAVSIGKKS
jgi:RNA polymerase sigma factor (sigma-70 family)